MAAKSVRAMLGSYGDGLGGTVSARGGAVSGRGRAVSGRGGERPRLRGSRRRCCGFSTGRPDGWLGWLDCVLSANTGSVGIWRVGRSTGDGEAGGSRMTRSGEAGGSGEAGAGEAGVSGGAALWVSGEAVWVSGETGDSAILNVGGESGPGGESQAGLLAGLSGSGPRSSSLTAEDTSRSCGKLPAFPSSFCFNFSSFFFRSSSDSFGRLS